MDIFRKIYGVNRGAAVQREPKYLAELQLFVLSA
jgi:hypothetical protein